jgi:predicted GIY-YIG superfamily endonuclease
LTGVAQLYWHYIVECGAHEKWLVRLRPWFQQLGWRKFSGLYSAASGEPVVYVIVSQLTGFFYVGETQNFQQRCLQHVYHATSWQRGTQHVHRFMQQFGAHKFVVLPLVASVFCELSRSCIERKLIRMLRPALNVEHVSPSGVLPGGLLASVGMRQHGKGCRPLLRQRSVQKQQIAADVRESYVTYTLVQGDSSQPFSSLDMLLRAAVQLNLDCFSVC